MIKPIVAGQFYDAAPKRLEKQVYDCFKNKLPEKKTAEKVFGIIAPHAGYAFSGPVAASAYKALAESNRERTFVIMAPDHNGLCNTITTTSDDFQTPLGIVKTDKPFVKNLLKECNAVREGLIREHAIEVQLPFIQLFFKDAKIVSLVIPSDENIGELAKAISMIGGCTIIASSDFTHHGFYYGYMPFRNNVREQVKNLDMGAIGFIEKMDARGFLNYVTKTGATICGCFAIAAAILSVKRLGARKAVLLQYNTSGDVSGDYENSVSYAALKFV